MQIHRKCASLARICEKDCVCNKKIESRKGDMKINNKKFEYDFFLLLRRIGSKTKIFIEKKLKKSVGQIKTCE